MRTYALSRPSIGAKIIIKRKWLYPTYGYFTLAEGHRKTSGADRNHECHGGRAVISDLRPRGGLTDILGPRPSSPLTSALGFLPFVALVRISGYAYILEQFAPHLFKASMVSCFHRNVYENLNARIHSSHTHTHITFTHIHSLLFKPIKTIFNNSLYLGLILIMFTCQWYITIIIVNAAKPETSSVDVSIAAHIAGSRVLGRPLPQVFGSLNSRFEHG